MASYCGWFFLPRRRFFRPSPLTGSPKMDRSTMIHDIPINCGLVWRKGTIAHSITWYIYIYMYIYIIYLVFHIKNQVLDVLGGSLSFFFGFFVARLHGLELPLWPARRTARSVVSIVETDATVSEETTDALAVWKSGWWLMMMVALW